MVVVAGSSFWIHEIRLVGPWSPIHLLSIFSLVMLVVGVLAARGHNVSRHKKTMVSIFAGALIIAGFFAFGDSKRAPKFRSYHRTYGGISWDTSRKTKCARRCRCSK